MYLGTNVLIHYHSLGTLVLQFGTCKWFVPEGKVPPEVHSLLEELRLHDEVVGSADVQVPELLWAGDWTPLHL